MSAASRPMRIVEVYTPLTVAGGGERQFLQEVSGLRRQGHEVLPVTFALDDAALQVPGVPRESITLLRGSSLAGRIAALRRFIGNARPDLVVTHTSPELAWAATAGRGIPLVIYHNSPIFMFLPDINPYLGLWRWHPAFRSGRVSLVSRAEFPGVPTVSRRGRLRHEVRALGQSLTMRAAARVVVLSQRAADELRAVHGVRASVIRGCLAETAVPRVDSAALREELGVGDAPVILSVCRLSPERRLDLLIRAFAVIRARGSAAHLVIAGRGREDAYLRRLAHLLQVGDRVHFTGFVPEDDLVRYHSLAHVFAAPAIADYNIAPYEAMAAGCNVIVTSEMELSPGMRASERVVVCEPTEFSLAAWLDEALARPLGPPPPLDDLTWEARARAVEALYREVVG